MLPLSLIMTTDPFAILTHCVHKHYQRALVQTLKGAGAQGQKNEATFVKIIHTIRKNGSRCMSEWISVNTMNTVSKPISKVGQGKLQWKSTHPCSNLICLSALRITRRNTRLISRHFWGKLMTETVYCLHFVNVGKKMGSGKVQFFSPNAKRAPPGGYLCTRLIAEHYFQWLLIVSFPAVCSESHVVLSFLLHSRENPKQATRVTSSKWVTNMAWWKA